jgi:hypothetical protein
MKESSPQRYELLMKVAEMCSTVGDMASAVKYMEEAYECLLALHPGSENDLVGFRAFIDKTKAELKARNQEPDQPKKQSSSSSTISSDPSLSNKTRKYSTTASQSLALSRTRAYSAAPHALSPMKPASTQIPSPVYGLWSTLSRPTTSSVVSWPYALSSRRHIMTASSIPRVPLEKGQSRHRLLDDASQACRSPLDMPHAWLMILVDPRIMVRGFPPLVSLGGLPIAKVLAAPHPPRVRLVGLMNTLSVAALVGVHAALF